jgi:hypothetical protein
VKRIFWINPREEIYFINNRQIIDLSQHSSNRIPQIESMMNYRAACRAVSGIATPKNCAACPAFYICYKRRIRGKPRFLHLPSNEKAGQAAHFVIEHVPEFLGNMFTPWGQAAGYYHPVPGLSAEGKRKREKKGFSGYPLWDRRSVQGCQLIQGRRSPIISYENHWG